ncbi:hypothetical protein ACRRTK_016706 [Alexandromys fortis]
MTCLGREGPRTPLLLFRTTRVPKQGPKCPGGGRENLSSVLVGAAQWQRFGRRGGHEVHSSGAGIPGEGPGLPRPPLSLRREHGKAFRTGHRRFSPATSRQSRRSPGHYLFPRRNPLHIVVAATGRAVARRTPGRQCCDVAGGGGGRERAGK